MARVDRIAYVAAKEQLMPKAIPEGYHAVTPYLACRDAAKAIAFYVEALGARELYRLPMPSGKLGHAELQIGDSRIMLSDEAPEWGNKSPSMLGGTPIALCIYTENIDALGERFVRAGGKNVRPIETSSMATEAVGLKIPRATNGC